MHSPFSAPDLDSPPDVLLDEAAVAMAENAADWLNVADAIYDKVGERRISATSAGSDCEGAVGRGA